MKKLVATLAALTMIANATGVADLGLLGMEALRAAAGGGGTTTITGTLESSTITATEGNVTYTFTVLSDTAEPKTVALTGCTLPSEFEGNLTLPDKVKLDGVDTEYTVTEVGADEATASILGSVADTLAKLTTVTFPESVTTIAQNAFKGCTAVNNVDVPATVKTIGVYAFQGCTALTALDFTNAEATPSQLTSIGDAAFQGCGLTEVELPAEVTYTTEENGENNTFDDNVEVSFEEPYTDINTGITYSGLNKRKINRCTTEATSIEIPASVETIADTAFDTCTKLTGFTVEDGNTKFSVGSEGLLYNNDKTELVRCPLGKKDTDETDAKNECIVTIPKTVKTINANAFNGCKGVTEIKVEASEQADPVYFAVEGGLLYKKGGNNLTELVRCLESATGNENAVTLPSTVTTIAKNAVKGCTGILKIMIAGTISEQKVGDAAFMNGAPLTIVCNYNW